jgi:predicted enzyme related to lactoylglutathione lyase
MAYEYPQTVAWTAARRKVGVMADLGEFPVAGVLRAEDIARARTFYTDVLGLKAMDAPGSSGEGMGMFTAGGGTMVMIYERPGMPAPENTTLGFGVAVDKFDEVIADLRGRGVIFEDYDLPDIGLKTVDGVGDYDGAKVAWFKDTEGNIINIASM